MNGFMKMARHVLALYPLALREQFGKEILLDLEERQQQGEGRTRLLLGLIRGLPAAHRQAWQREQRARTAVYAHGAVIPGRLLVDWHLAGRWIGQAGLAYLPGSIGAIGLGVCAWFIDRPLANGLAVLFFMMVALSCQKWALLQNETDRFFGETAQVTKNITSTAVAILVIGTMNLFFAAGTAYNDHFAKVLPAFYPAPEACNFDYTEAAIYLLTAISMAVSLMGAMHMKGERKTNRAGAASPMIIVILGIPLFLDAGAAILSATLVGVAGVCWLALIRPLHKTLAAATMITPLLFSLGFIQASTWDIAHMQYSNYLSGKEDMRYGGQLIANKPLGYLLVDREAANSPACRAKKLTNEG